jgi:hypothetical protein
LTRSFALLAWLRSAIFRENEATNKLVILPERVEFDKIANLSTMKIILYKLVRPQKSPCRFAFHSNHLVDLPEPGNLPLTLSKSALRCIIGALQSENRNSKIFFSSICPGVFCYNNPCILSLENRDALQKNIESQMSPQTKKILKSIYLEKRIQYCTSRFEGFNSLEPVLDYYFDALFRYFLKRLPRQPVYDKQAWSQFFSSNLDR